MALQNPSSTLTEIVTTTLRNRTGKLADNITKNNALLFRLRKRGNVKTVSGAAPSFKISNTPRTARSSATAATTS